MKSSLYLAKALLAGIKWHILGLGALYALFAVISLNMLLTGNESAALLISPIFAAGFHRFLFFTTIDSNRFRTLQLLPVDRATKGRALWWCSVGIFLCLVCAVINPLVILTAISMHSKHEASMRTLLLYWTTLCLATFGIFKSLPALLATARRALEACKVTPLFLTTFSVLLSAVVIFLYAQLPRSLEGEPLLWRITALLGLIAAIGSYVRSAKLMDFVENLLDAKVKARANRWLQIISRTKGDTVPPNKLRNDRVSKLTGWEVPADDLVRTLVVQTASFACVWSALAMYDKHLTGSMFYIVPLITSSNLIVGYTHSIRTLRTLPLTSIRLALILNLAFAAVLTVVTAANVSIGSLLVDMNRWSWHLTLLAGAAQLLSIPISLIYKETTGIRTAFRPFFTLLFFLAVIDTPMKSANAVASCAIAGALIVSSVLWTQHLVQSGKKVYRIDPMPDPTRRKFSFFDAAPPRQ